MNRYQEAKTPNPPKLQRVLRVVCDGVFDWVFRVLVLYFFLFGFGCFLGFFLLLFSLFGRLFS